MLFCDDRKVLFSFELSACEGMWVWLVLIHNICPRTQNLARNISLGINYSKSVHPITELYFGRQIWIKGSRVVLLALTDNKSGQLPAILYIDFPISISPYVKLPNSNNMNTDFLHTIMAGMLYLPLRITKTKCVFIKGCASLVSNHYTCGLTLPIYVICFMKLSVSILLMLSGSVLYVCDRVTFVRKFLNLDHLNVLKMNHQ